jgi:alpha-L-rhamnosidase
VLQPSIVPLDDRRAVALLRNAVKGYVHVTRTGDGGLTWDPLQPVSLPNPNAPVMGLRLRDGAVLAVFNNSPVSRDALSLAVSRDGGATWQVLHSFENGERGWDGVPINFSYPYAVQAADGVIHLVYVWRKYRVKHVAFNEAWLSVRPR